MYERLLLDFELDKSSTDDNIIRLKNPEGYIWTLTLITPLIFRVTVEGPDRPLPPHDNFVRPLPAPLPFLELKHSSDDGDARKTTSFSFSGGTKHLIIDYTRDIVISITETLVGLPEGDERRKKLMYQTLPGRGYCLGEHGIVRYDRVVDGSIHMGLGEKAAPIDLTGRDFKLTGTDAAAYDAYLTDPLYKHTPFLIALPRPIPIKPIPSPTSNLLNNYWSSIELSHPVTGEITTHLEMNEWVQPSAYGTWWTSNSDGVVDIRRGTNDPNGVFRRYEQGWGGLEEIVILGDSLAETKADEGEEYQSEKKWLSEGLEVMDKRRSGRPTGLREVVRAYAGLVGSPLLVPRDWLGYLASGMGIGESDSPIAQQLLENWPDECEKYDIPCSGMHLSSGYTVGEEDGNRYVFGMNKRRYPDFKAMVEVFHKRGIRVIPNIKPYVLNTHPDYARLKEAGALFLNPWTKSNVTAPIWSAGVGMTQLGSWVDMTHPVGRGWWYEGVKGLVELGCDGMWNDNNEYLLHNDDYVPHWDDATRKYNAFEGKTNVGTLGRMYNTQLMAKTSHDACLDANPDRRTFVLTRSGNVGTFRYASSTWSGDNYTNWKTLRGSVAMGLNAGLSLMQSYGTDVGGFAGPLPSPELFVRWVQFGCTNSRFCIHSFKPNKTDLSGSLTNNLPWMYPEVLPIIRDTIKRRYELMPYLNSLNWESSLLSEPPNSYLGSGPFAQDPNLFSAELLESFDYWMGTGRLLVAGAFQEGQTKKRVYFPQAYPGDVTPYIRVSTDIQESYPAGIWAEIDLPLAEFAIFARAGAVIPFGKDHVTVTRNEGIAKTCVGGTEVQVGNETDKGVSLDDYRGIEIFPPADASADFHGEGSWIEDDGVSRKPTTTIVKVEYRVAGDEIEVEAKFVKRDFEVAWGTELWVCMPKGDTRVVKGGEKSTRKGRQVYKIVVQ